ncbi:sensor histidine kinase [Litorimonas sp.]|uniref:sensor histidine kinase n=1 Tax=Litorimonas sp. TaxID=1892381 RepID=UPI003A8B2958
MTESRQPRSLVTGLVRGAAMWAIPILILSAVVLTWLYRTTTYRIFDDPLDSAVTSLIASVDVNDNGVVALSREPLDPRYQRALSGRYWLIGRVGEKVRAPLLPLAASRSLYGESLTLDPPVLRELKSNMGEAVRASTQGVDTGETLRIVARQVILPGTDQPVIVLAGADKRAATRDIQRFALTAIGLMTALCLALIFAVFTQVRVGLSPLFTLRNKVADIREGKAAQVEGIYPPEIAPLAEELNSLIIHNKNIVERARTHVGNLAHALKTPLAVLQNEAQGGKSTPSKLVTKQTEIMRQQVDHHLRRARAAARGQAIGVTTPLEEVIEPLTRTLPRIYRDKDLLIDVESEPSLVFRGAKRDLEDMVGNLMDNAAKWTKSDIRLRAKTDEERPDMIRITIEDNGAGLDPREYEEALKRGARLDEATPGSGLGLAIVDDLARAYKGLIHLSRSDMGGLQADLILPKVGTS